MTRYLKMSRAADELEISRQRMYALVKTKLVPVVIIDGVKFIDMDNLGDKWKPQGKEKPPTP